MAAVEDAPQLVVLGIGQDGGCPQIGCVNACCCNVDVPRVYASCLAVVDVAAPTSRTPPCIRTNRAITLVECTPDVREQYSHLRRILDCWVPGNIISNVVITHAHTGHFLGLPFFGKEMMGLPQSDGVSLWGSPSTIQFLTTNEPFHRVIDENFGGGCKLLEPDAPGRKQQLSANVTMESFFVPHRVETVGIVFEGPNRRVAFIPDIDYWRRPEGWNSDCDEVDFDVLDLVRSVDMALVDGTFFDGEELPGRDMTKIAHPTILSSVEETFGRDGFSEAERRKVRFIHLNHTNPVLRENSSQRLFVEEMGFGVATQFEVIPL